MNSSDPKKKNKLIKKINKGMVDNQYIFMYIIV